MAKSCGAILHNTALRYVVVTSTAVTVLLADGSAELLYWFMRGKIVLYQYLRKNPSEEVVNHKNIFI